MAEGGARVRALVRPGGSTSSLTDLHVEIVEADVRDSDSLLTAFADADVVFHVAGTVSIAGRGLKPLRETNVLGTRNVLEACGRTGVRRLVYTSSVHAFVEAPSGTCLTETEIIDPSQTRGPYARSKAEATLLVREAAERGLDIVTVFPSAIVGPYDFRPSHTGELILACCQGRLKAYVHGAYNFVDVRDVAQGLVTAATEGRAGEGYILAGHETTVEGLLLTVEQVAGTPAPQVRLPLGLARAASGLAPAYYWATRQQALFTSYSLHVITSNCSMSTEKAQRELGYTPRPFATTVEDTIAWFRQQGMLAGPS